MTDVVAPAPTISRVADSLSAGGGSDCSLTFVGTATMLLRFGPFTLLTDPNFLHRNERAYLGYGLTSKRLTEPALQLTELPALDAVLLSHLHGDHWDRVARRGLDAGLPVLSTPQAARKLHRQGFSAAVGLETWSEHEMRSGDHLLTVTALPGRHGPGPTRFLLPAVMGSLITYRPTPSAPALRLYITGDTLLIEDLRDIPRRCGPLDVAVLHLGGTRLPGGLMVTMDAVQGAELVEILQAATAVPIHFDDYGVFKSPRSDFTAEIRRRGLTDRVTYVERGQTIAL
jgi:L-ascorbate metabolism protein UlaG (beta-lactamase superfamily)